MPELRFPNGIDTKTARRLADIADALDADMVDANLYDLSPARCASCGCELEGGHCYCCSPVSGYGERWQRARHG